MSVPGARLFAAARRRTVALALSAAFSLGLGACTRHAEPPVMADAAPDRPLLSGPVVRDAALDSPADAQPIDAQPDAAGPRHARSHRTAPPARAAGGAGFKLEGSLTRGDAETVLRGARGKLDACYDKERLKSAALAGRVIFRLSIDDRGRVPLAEVLTSTLGGGDPELCMVETLRDLKFPPSATGGQSTLSFPMTFGR
jgi:hypothetical protein